MAVNIAQQPKFGKHLPKELSEIIDMIQDRLNKA